MAGRHHLRRRILGDGRPDIGWSYSTLAALRYDVGDMPGDTPVSLMDFTTHDGKEYWIGRDNFYAIMRYNPRTKYAMAVYQLAEAVRTEVEAQLRLLSRAGIAREALAQSRVITVDTLDEAIAISNRYAPEHLILQIRGAREKLDGIRNAGSVFIGDWSPESVGDYCSGTNHVLPTYGYGSAYSGLGIDQFMRLMTIQELSMMLSIQRDRNIL